MKVVFLDIDRVLNNNDYLQKQLREDRYNLEKSLEENMIKRLTQKYSSV